MKAVALADIALFAHKCNVSFSHELTKPLLLLGLICLTVLNIIFISFVIDQERKLHCP